MHSDGEEDGLDPDTIRDAAALERRLREADIDLEELIADKATRRDLLKATGALGVGAVLGGGTAAFTERAAAGTNQVGTVGAENSPLDLYAEDLFAKSQSGTPTPPTGFGVFVDDNGTPKHVDEDGNVTDLGGAFDDTDNDGVAELQDDHADFQGGGARNVSELTGSYPTKVYGITDDGVVASVDPANTTTPVQDAVDAVDADMPAQPDSTGIVILPPRKISEAGVVDMRDKPGVDVVGWGGPRGCSIDYPDNVSAFLLSGNFQNNFEGFRIESAESGSSTPVFKMDKSGSLQSGKVYSIGIDKLTVRNWYGSFIEAGGQSPFQISIAANWVRLVDIDAGDEPAVINWTTGGRSNTVGLLSVAPVDTVSATDSTIYDDITGAENEISIRALNLAGSSGTIANCDGQFHLDWVNFEPTTQNTTPDLFQFRGSGAPFRVWSVTLTGNPSINSVYQIYGQEGAMTYPWDRGGASSVSTNWVDIQDSPGGPPYVYYFGTSAQISNNSGETNSSVRSLASAGAGNG